MFGFIKNNKRILEISGVIIILLIFAGQSFFSILNESLTTDEPIHIGAGYSYLKKWDMRMNPEHPPFIKMISALPLLPLNLDGKFRTKVFLTGDQGDYGYDFVYKNTKSVEKISLISRIPIIIFGVVLGLYIFLWAKELFGTKAGLLALLLYSFSPTVLAHSHLVTTDIGVTLFIFISSYYFWKLYKEKLWRYTILSGIFLGLALVSKFTALYMILFFSLMTTIQIIIDIKNKSSLFKKRIFWLIIIFFIGFAIIWLIYLPFGKPYFTQQKSIFSLMPANYAKGAEILLEHTKEGHKSFFFGETSENGWWYYYFVSYIIKEPFSFLILLFISFILFFIRMFKNNGLRKTHFIVYLIPLLIILWTSFLNKTNIGIRHILPAYPFIFIFISNIVNLKFKKYTYQKTFCVVISILIIWYIGNNLWIYPDYLMHFNELIGGPDNGFRYSVVGDDWGQSDFKLIKWMKENNYKKFNFLASGSRSSRYVKLYASKNNMEINVTRCDRAKEKIHDLKEGIPLAIHIGTAQREPTCFQNLLLLKPLSKIGYNVFIYDFKKQKIDINLFRSEN